MTDFLKSFINEEQIKLLAENHPKVLKLFKESEEERIIYKKAELNFRRYEEKRIVQKMLKTKPNNIDMEISLLFKAKSFISGDFVYSAKYVENTFLIWLGDSISHGTGSKIVKDSLRDIIFQAFTYLNKRHEYSLVKLVNRVQKEFYSKKMVQKILNADLSDIIISDDYYSKMAIVIPIIFFQVRKQINNYQIRFANRGMPLVVIIRKTANSEDYNKIFCFTRKDIYNYGGKNKRVLEIINLDSFPLILDKSLFNDLTKKDNINNNQENCDFITIEEFTAQSGDLIIIPSDGILEVTNIDGEEFGFNRFIDSLVDTFFDPIYRDIPLNITKEQYYQNNIRKFGVWNEDYPISGQGIGDDITALFIKLK